jgi:large subunit ribosomal protein L25
MPAQRTQQRSKDNTTMSIDRSSLEAKVREGSGKGAARRLRATGLVPAVVYGKHLEKPAHVAVDPVGVKKAIATPHKFNTLITLKVAGQGEKTVLLKDYQNDPVSRAILHVDFIEVRENEPVKVNVPVVLVGKADGVANGGILSQVRRELEVWALPAAIPEKIEVDVTPLKIAQAMHINDVKLPAGITVKTHVNYTIAVVSAPEKEEAAPVAAAAAAPAAGAAAPAAAAGGDKAAAGAKPAAGAAAAKPAAKK